MSIGLPTPGGDAGQWGTKLNAFLRIAHRETGAWKHAASVLDYGNPGDGDATPIFQAALDDTASGGCVIIPAGTYWIRPDASTIPNPFGGGDLPCGLKLPAHCHVFFAPGAVLRALGVASAFSSLFVALDVTDVQLVGGTLIGDRATHGPEGAGGFGVWLLGASQVTLDSLTVQDCIGDGLVVGGSANLAACQDVRVTDCRFVHHRRNGASVSSAERLHMERCIFTATDTRMGLDLEMEAPNDTLVDVTIENCSSFANGGQGFVLLNGSGGTLEQVQFAGCTARDNNGAGLLAYRATAGDLPVTIDRLSAIRNGGPGIQITRAQGAQIVQSRAVGNGGPGIFLDDGCTANHVNGNQITDNAGNGLELVGSDNLVSQNIIRQPLTGGIHIANAANGSVSAGNALIGNFVTGGIVVDPAAGTQALYGNVTP